MGTLFTPSHFLRGCLFGAVIAFVLSPVIFSYVVNLWFAQNEEAILTALGEIFQAPVEASRIHYTFLGIVVEDFVLGEGIDPALPSPIRVSRIRIRPSLSFFPHFGFKIGRIVFEEPVFALRADIQEFLQAGRFLNASLDRDRRFGPFYLRMRLSSLEVRNGKMTLLSPKKDSFRQEFEGIRLFLGKRLFGGERLVLKGHIAGNPKASFQLVAHVKNPLPETTHADLSFDCHEFATAYLRPHLGGSLELPDETLTATIKVKVRHGRTFASKGKIAFPVAIEGKNFLSRFVPLISSPLSYEVRGTFEKERYRLNKLVLKTEGIQLKGEGEVKLSGPIPAYDITLSSGKIPAQAFRRIFPELKISSGKLRFVFMFSGSAKKISPYLYLVLEDCAFQDTERHLSWSKVDGRIRLYQDRCVVDEIWAFVNNFPLRIHGELHRLRHPNLRLEVSTYPGQVSTLRSKNPLNAALQFIGDYNKGKWSGDLWMTHLLYGERGEDLGKWTAAFHGITAEGLFPHRFSQDLFEGKSLQCQFLLVRQEGAKQRLNRLAIRSASFFLSAERELIRCDLLEGTLNRGKVLLQGWINTRKFPNASWTVTGSVTDADLASFLGSFTKRYPVTGQLSFEGTWHRQKGASEVLGRFRLSNGLLGPTPFLQQFSDEVGIEALRQIQFREFSGQVAYRDGDFDLDHVKILSDQTELVTNVKVREGRLSGTLYAKFPKDSIRESSDLRRLLDYVGGDWVDFDFRVVGSLTSPRMQWLESEFKRKIETKLSPAMREYVGREIGKLVGVREENETPGNKGDFPGRPVGK